MIVTTSDGVEDRPVSQYLGIVSGEAVMGANIFKDFSPVFAISSADARPLTKKN